MTLVKKFASAALATATILSMSGVLSLTANAQSTADLQSQIQALLAQIAQLQSQMGGSSSSGGSSAACTFTRSLTVGSKGTDVTCLQDALIAKGHLAAGLNTGYFGALTKAAVVKWQTAAGVSPASGYFGPLSRAAFASMGGGSTSGGGSTGGGTSVPGSGIAVSLAAGSAMGSVISGAGQIDMGTWNLTASNSGSVTVTGLTFNKIGVVSDSSVSNLYLVDPVTGAVTAQYSSLNSGVATFSGLNITVPAGQTVRVGLRMDMSGATAGNTLAWALASVSSASSAAVSGVPSNGNTLTVTSVSSPALATAAWTTNTVGSTVDAGTQNVQIATAGLLVSNSPVWLKSLKYTIVGSANMGDIRNLKLMLNGVQVGTTVSSPAADGSVAFNFVSSPVKVNTGNNTIDLFADVAGSPSRDITVRVLRPYDLYFVDSQYNSGLTPTVTDTSATKITINNGQITVQLSTDSPTGNVAIGMNNVTLAKFTIYASGEPVKVLALDLNLTPNAARDWNSVTNMNTDVTNISLVDDAGNQIGSTISTVVYGSGNGQCAQPASAGLAATCHFGTLSSPINYIVPANTTRVISAKADIKTGATSLTSIKASLPGTPASNLQGQISFQTTSSGSANGAILTVVTNPLTAAKNGAFGTPTYVAGASNVKIASFVVTASSADGAKLNSLSFDKDNNDLLVQNVKVMVGSTQFGATRATVDSGATYPVALTFSGTPISVPVGGSVTVDVYADILSNTSSTTKTSPIDLTGWSAVGAASQSSISFGTAQSGQDVSISSGPTLTVAADGSTPSAKQIVMGTTANNVLAVLLTANNVEDVKVTSIQFLDTVTGATSSGQTSFSNMTLWDGATQLGGTVVPSMAGFSSSTFTFNLSTPLIIAKSGSKTLTLKGDVADYSSGAVSGSIHTFSVNSTSTVVAYGKDSNGAATVSGSAGGTAQTIYRTKLSLTASVIGSTAGRSRTAIDDLATVNWTANSAYQVLLGTVSVKFSGQAVSSGSTAFTVDLLKPDGTALGSASQATCTPGAGNSCVVTFSPQFTISAGATQSSKIRVNSGSFYDAASASESLTAFINATTDVLWNDGTTAAIPVESSVVPFTIASVQY